jgi:inosine/xanthosine triphosphate pyrophosphatase family protein
MKIVAATRNRAKLAELARIAGDCAEVVPLPPDLDGEQPEGERSIEENAIAKAGWWSCRVPEIVIASDGGLEIPALGDSWNPVLTRRFAGPDATDLDRAHALLDLAADLTGEQRRIAWLEVVAVAREGELLGSFSGRGDPGYLAETVDPARIEAGHGFWIPALWRCPEFANRRLAELGENERKHLGDHWNEIAAPLRRLLSGIRLNSPPTRKG